MSTAASTANPKRRASKSNAPRRVQTRASSLTSLRDDALGREGTVRTLAALLGRRTGSVVCRRSRGRHGHWPSDTMCDT